MDLYMKELSFSVHFLSISRTALHAEGFLPTGKNLSKDFGRQVDE
jgi:hypothetical protein